MSFPTDGPDAGPWLIAAADIPTIQVGATTARLVALAERIASGRTYTDAERAEFMARHDQSEVSAGT